jgi:tetratricopeptide (TPR) repeat protein
MRGPIAVAALLLAFAAPLRADDSGARYAELSAIFEDGDYAAAAAGLAELVAGYEAQYVQTDKEQFYCSSQLSLGLIYATMGAKSGSKVNVLGPEWCEALFMQAYAYTELNRPAEAVASLRKAVALAPLDPRYAAELGFALRSVGDLDAALEEYQRADSVAEWADDDEQSRYHAVAWRGICWVHSERRAWDLAAQACRKSLEFEPGNEIALGELDYIEENRKPD